ncbi:MAG: bifunctional (p)ppGpp synthetase/guanosine-3',5'-bis(diphosphate) 3'-pyrophosphohydrolase, partial [Aquificaceae bacterium]
MEATLNRKYEEKLFKVLGYEDSKVKKAIEFIEEKHAGQYRKSGEPYVVHPLEVAIILAELDMDIDTVVAGLLHDVLEDTETTYEELKENFGKDVADIVEGVTKLGKIHFKDVETQKAENYRKLILAFSKDLRVIFVKLADRLHNMKTLQYFSKEKQVRIARETLEIYVPIANRLGLWKIKTELEDLCFMYLYPKEYEEVKNFVGRSRRELEDYLKRVFIPRLKEELKKAGIQAHVSYRPKHLYGIWQKTLRKGIKLEDVHDILGVRVIVNTVQECYLVLGIVHSVFKPVPGKFDDYISLPKPNLYQSLHTAVIGPKGRMVEVQIRTWEMHERAEKGIAAHWAYKEGKSLKDGGVYSWLKSLVESVQGSKNPQELLENLKLELFSEEVFVFTPKGDLLVLPKGATPVDFAYYIHTEVGNHCAGAKVNGRIVPLNYRLQNGDMVEIITNPNKKPNQEWLNFVVTSKAKSKIKSVLKELERERYVQLGRERLELYSQKLGLGREMLLKRLIEETGAKGEEEVYLLLGSGKLSKERVYSLFRKTQKEKPQGKVEDALHIDGLGKVLHALAECCNPLPGEEVYGVISKGKGLVIHSKDCPNLNYLLKISPEKVVKVLWDRSQGLHPVRIRLLVKDRLGILGEVTTAIGRLGANITEARTKSLPSGQALMDFTLQVENYQSFLKVKEALSGLEGVESVQRLMG